MAIGPRQRRRLAWLVAIAGRRCWYCGAPTFEGPAPHDDIKAAFRWSWDHRIPRSRGGRTDESNLRPACNLCNKLKGARTLDEYRTLIISAIRGSDPKIHIPFMRRVPRLWRYARRTLTFYCELVPALVLVDLEAQTQIPRGGRGTGTVREKRMYAATPDWSDCVHACQLHGRWSHRVPPTLVCERRRYGAECPKCIELDPYNRHVDRIVKPQ